jgi:hypothetical protein
VIPPGYGRDLARGDDAGPAPVDAADSAPRSRSGYAGRFAAHGGGRRGRPRPAGVELDPRALQPGARSAVFWCPA